MEEYSIPRRITYLNQFGVALPEQPSRRSPRATRGHPPTAPPGPSPRRLLLAAAAAGLAAVAADPSLSKVVAGDPARRPPRRLQARCGAACQGGGPGLRWWPQGEAQRGLGVLWCKRFCGRAGGQGRAGAVGSAAQIWRRVLAGVQGAGGIQAVGKRREGAGGRRTRRPCAVRSRQGVACCAFVAGRG
jgi:hypothetical protein